MKTLDGPSWSTKGLDRATGRYPLSFERHVMRMAELLVPGVTTVTPHARYYAPHALIAGEAARMGLEEGQIQELRGFRNPYAASEVALRIQVGTRVPEPGTGAGDIPDRHRVFGDLVQDPVPADSQPPEVGRPVGERSSRAGIVGQLVDRVQDLAYALRVVEERSPRRRGSGRAAGAGRAASDPERLRQLEADTGIPRRFLTQPDLGAVRQAAGQILAPAGQLR